MRLIDILKVSQGDLAWLYPRLSEDRAISLWHAAGIPLVVVTHGEHGAVASTPLASATVAAPRVPVVDTVGAGDAFMSGALAHLHDRGLLNREALRSLDIEGLEQMLQDACLVASIPVRGLAPTPLVVVICTRACRVVLKRSF